jgi:putative SOS response-associated peptidase YedK
MIGKRLDWADFLLLMAGLWEAKSATDEQQIAHLAQGERSDEEFESFTLLSTPQAEEIVARHADRVIRELKKLLR